MRVVGAICENAGNNSRLLEQLAQLAEMRIIIPKIIETWRGCWYGVSYFTIVKQ